MQLYGESSSGTVRGYTQTTVYVKQYWSDAWIFVPHLRAIRATDTISPSVPEAEFLYHFGVIKRYNAADYSTYFPNSIGDWYIAIFQHNNYGGGPLWVGVIQSQSYLMHGSSNYAQGDQVIRAYGLEHLMDRIEIAKAYTDAGVIDRGLVFNARTTRGNQQRGNRSTATGAGGVYKFSTDGELWTARQMIEYLLYGFAPSGPTWFLSGQLDILDDITFTFDPDGLTLKQAIDKIIDRRRGIAWRLFVDAWSGYVYIYVFSMISESISVGEYTIAANPMQAYLNFDGDIAVTPEIEVDSRNSYDTIWVRGGPVYSCFTLAFADATLVKGWSTTLEQAYKDGSDAVGAGAMEHDAERTTDKFNSVYQLFVVPTAWDGTAGDGAGGAKSNVFPEVLADGNLDTATAALWWRGDKVFSRELPFLDSAESEDDKNYRAPFALCYVDAETAYSYVERLNNFDLTPMQVRLSDRSLGIIVEARPNHVLALNHFDSGVYDTGTEPEIDYESLLCTVNMATDRNIEAYVTLGNATPREFARIKRIDVPNAEAWYVVPGTVVDVKDGALVHYGDAEFPAATGNLERDDSETLRNLAVLAAAYYGQVRNSIRFEVKKINNWFTPGTQIRAVQTSWAVTIIGSTISQQVWDFERQTTMYSSGHSELDFQMLGQEGSN